jgi:Tfp pilus assembly protein PilF
VETTSQTLTQAVRLHQQGHLSAAECLYRQVLDRRPEHPGALHLLGVLRQQQDAHAEAAELIARAIALNPDQATYYVNQGVVLRALGQLEAAEAALHAAIRLTPDVADAHSNVGLVLHLQGKPQQAQASFESALRFQSEHVDVLFNLANLYREQAKEELAVPLYERAHRAAPHRADVLNNLGNA